MLKQAVYFLAFFIFFAGTFVLAERAFSPVFQSCINQDKNTNTEATTGNNPSFGTVSVYVGCSGEFIERHDGAITAISTIIIAAFTGTLWMATSGLLGSAVTQSRHTEIAAKAAKKSAEVAEKSLIAATRPHVIISPIEPREANESQSVPHIHFGLTNSGNGAAIVNKVVATIEITPRGGNVLTLATTPAKFVVSGVKIEPRGTISDNHIPLSAPEWQQIKTGEKRLGVVFHVTASDIFQTPYPEEIFTFAFEHGIFKRFNILTPEK
jgi:hypothetical protein